jgi:hypothetical protein
MPKFQLENVATVVDNAYHGTDLATTRKIIAGERFRYSRGPDQWLGNGVYFFEGSIGLATYFGKRKARQKRSEDYAVLRASVQLGRCLDLTTEKYRQQLAKWIELLRTKATLKLSRAWIINSFVMRGCRGCDTVRCRFPPGLPGDSESAFAFSKQEHIQIAVLTVNNISNIAFTRKGKTR